MSRQRVNLYVADVTHTGRVQTIRLVSQQVTGPAGADGAGVSVATKENGTQVVAVTTALDFLGADFNVSESPTGEANVSLAVTPEAAGTAAAAVATHVGLADPHTQYALESALGTAAYTASTAYATSAQGATADTAVQPARSISTTAPLTGGGDMSASRTFAINTATTSQAGAVSALATSAETITGTDTSKVVTPAGFAAGLAKQPEFATIAIGDETTAITTGTAKVTWRAPMAMTITAVRASLTTASSSGLPTVDINEGGTTILSTKLTIDANELTSTTAATPAVISDTAIADDAELTFDIDVAGTGAKGLKVTIYWTRA